MPRSLPALAVFAGAALAFAGLAGWPRPADGDPAPQPADRRSAPHSAAPPAANPSSGPAAATEFVVVSRVRWPVVVEPRRRAPKGACEALGTGDLALREDGRAARITSLDREDGPVLYAVLVDTSASMGERLEEISRALVEFVGTLRDRDTLAIASFADKLTIVTEPTRDRARVEDAIRTLPRGSRTALFDALREYVDHIAPLPERKAVVLVTDGADTSSRKRTIDVARVAARSEGDLRVCSIVTASREDGPGTASLHLLAEATGGRYEWVQQTSGVRGALDTIRRRAENEVVVTYVPAAKPSGEPRRVRIDVGVREGLPCRVRALARHRVVLPPEIEP